MIPAPLTDTLPPLLPAGHELELYVDVGVCVIVARDGDGAHYSAVADLDAGELVALEPVVGDDLEAELAARLELERESRGV